MRYTFMFELPFTCIEVPGFNTEVLSCSVFYRKKMQVFQPASHQCTIPYKSGFPSARLHASTTKRREGMHFLVPHIATMAIFLLLQLLTIFQFYCNAIMNIMAIGHTFHVSKLNSASGRTANKEIAWLRKWCCVLVTEKNIAVMIWLPRLGNCGLIAHAMFNMVSDGVCLTWCLVSDNGLKNIGIAQHWHCGPASSTAGIRKRETGVWQG